MKFFYQFIFLFLATGFFANSALTQEQIGVASAVNKNTTDLTLEQERKLVDAGYEIIQNHTIETDGVGRAQMLLLDGTAFSVGPNSSVVLDKFIYNPETAEGSLEVTARGILRIVGGKVTKKQPALIRTNSATVGIRGGIGIVQTVGSQTNATFLYGTEMTVTPNCVDQILLVINVLQILPRPSLNQVFQFQLKMKSLSPVSRLKSPKKV